MNLTAQVTRSKVDTYADTQTGKVVDVGLPEGHVAIAVKNSVGLWIITHVQSGGRIGLRPEIRLKDAIECARDFVQRDEKKTEKAIRTAMTRAAKYRREMWNHAQKLERENT